MKAVMFWLQDHTHPSERAKGRTWIEVSAQECWQPVKVPSGQVIHDKDVVAAWLKTWTWATVYSDDPGHLEPYFPNGLEHVCIAFVEDKVIDLLDFPWPSGSDSIDYACMDFAVGFCKKHAVVVHQFGEPIKVCPMGIVRELVMERLREMVEVIEVQYELTDDERAEAQRLRDELIEHLNN